MISLSRIGQVTRLVDRANCVKAVKGFEPTYTELLTCLEMARDVKKIK